VSKPPAQSKRAELRIDGGAGELDRQVLERMLPPFESRLRRGPNTSG
jgi:chemotaxis protein histidine kinase CheA